jgi:putative heme degradation protein
MKISIFNSLTSDIIIIVSNYCVLRIFNGEIYQLTSFLRESWIQVANKYYLLIRHFGIKLYDIHEYLFK